MKEILPYSHVRHQRNYLKKLKDIVHAYKAYIVYTDIVLARLWWTDKER